MKFSYLFYYLQKVILLFWESVFPKCNIQYFLIKLDLEEMSGV